jgi:acyl-CoA reductase-like NAD-dependent aldehyde dehydrogenase
MSFRLTYSTMFDPPAELHVRFAEALARTGDAAAVTTHLLHIAGEDRESRATQRTYNPANLDQALGTFHVGTPEDAKAALEAAHRAWNRWRRTPAPDRLRMLRRVGALIEERVFDIAAALTLEVGKNRMEALAEAQETADFFHFYCDQYEAKSGFTVALPSDPVAGYDSRNRSVLKPYGPWVVIAPFNFPFALAGGPVAAALVTGNTVVLKGSPTTPWAGRLLADCIRDAGLPPGVFNYIGGAGREVGAVLVEDPLTAGVTFTGSYQAGTQIVARLQAGPYPRPCIAEMGGKNACIVTPSADLERAVCGITRSAFGMAGQKCSALSRLYVHEKVADALLAGLAEATVGLRIGDPARQDNWLGPVATRSGYDRFGEYVEQLRAGGARLTAGGTVLTDGGCSRGLFVAPTIAEAPPRHPLWSTEMFLPILMVHRVRSNDEAMQLANSLHFGLTAGFYGGADEVAWFLDNIEAGVTYVNRPQGATTGAWPGYQPFGGWKGSGNTGKGIASEYYLPQYLREQSQTVVG